MCYLENCLLGLCPTCICSHTEMHMQNKTTPQFENIRTTFSRVHEEIQTQIELISDDKERLVRMVKCRQNCWVPLERRRKITGMCSKKVETTACSSSGNTSTNFKERGRQKSPTRRRDTPCTTHTDLTHSPLSSPRKSTNSSTKAEE